MSKLLVKIKSVSMYVLSVVLTMSIYTLRVVLTIVFKALGSILTLINSHFWIQRMWSLSNIAPPVPSDATIPTSSGTEDVSTETTIRIEFTIPSELNANGEIERVVIVVKLYISTNNTIDSWYNSNRARPRNTAPPWRAIEDTVSNMRRRGLVTRQSDVS